MKTASNRFLGVPHTRLGRWSIWLEVVFVVMFIVNVAVLSLLTDETLWHESILPFYGSIMLLSGLTGGIVGSIAVIRRHERSWSVWLAILCALFVLLITLNELIQLAVFLLGVSVPS
jgi:uncharacterized membrane protein YhaH (DUF805 family)